MFKLLMLTLTVGSLVASEKEIIRNLSSCTPYPYDAKGTADFAPCAQAFTSFMAALNSHQKNDGLMKEFAKIEPVISGAFENYSGAHKSDAMDLFAKIKTQISSK